MISGKRYSEKRERKRIRRARILKGRLIAYGSKSVPFAVKLEIEAAKEKRQGAAGNQ